MGRWCLHYSECWDAGGVLCFLAASLWLCLSLFIRISFIVSVHEYNGRKCFFVYSLNIVSPLGCILGG